MLTSTPLPLGLALVVASHADKGFIDNLFGESHKELRLADGERDITDLVISQHFAAARQDSGPRYPNVVTFLLQLNKRNIGAMVVDFGLDEVRLIFLACSPEASGLGYGEAALRALQQGASTIRCPVAKVVRYGSNDEKKRFLASGFKVVDTGPAADLLKWYPEPKQRAVA